MDSEGEGDLRKRIIDEMTVDYASALERNFELAKQLVRITQEGRVEVRERERLPGTDQILLYLIGKLYAKEAGLADEDNVGNVELLEELGIREGSLHPWLKSLRDGKMIKRIKKGQYSHHSISVNVVERTLQRIQDKMKAQD
jgi:hypothetical protein